MWIEIIGPAGSGKHLIAEFLTEKYEVMKDYVPQPGADALMTNLGYFVKRFLNSNFAFRNKMTKDLITIRGIYDTIEVYARASHDLKIMSDRDFNMLSEIKNLITDTDLLAPDLTLYCKMKKMKSIDTLLVRNDETVDLNFFNKEFELYELYKERINSFTELDMTRPLEEIKKDVDFFITSAKAAKKMSIWQRKYFRDY